MAEITALKEKWLNINVNINKINKKIQRSNDIMKNEMETKVIDFEGGKIITKSIDDILNELKEIA